MKTLKEEILKACRSLIGVLEIVPEPHKLHHLNMAAEEGAKKAITLFMQRARDAVWVLEKCPNQQWNQDVIYLEDLERIAAEVEG